MPSNSEKEREKPAEVTLKAFRLQKRHLDVNERKKYQMRKETEAVA